MAKTPAPITTNPYGWLAISTVEAAPAIAVDSDVRVIGSDPTRIFRVLRIEVRNFDSGDRTVAEITDGLWGGWITVANLETVVR